ncbi:MAG: hypothetical protein IM607_15625 [Cytophagales bacterium]|jgi:hypothetical protein|nr:hypothetical protein [Cytophagales bacterium]
MKTIRTVAKVNFINSEKYQHLVGRYFKVINIFRCPETGKVKIVECRLWSKEYGHYITLAFYGEEFTLATIYPNQESLFLATRTGGKPSRKRMPSQIV